MSALRLRRAPSALLLAALLGGCGGTYAPPSSAGEVYRKRIERLDRTASTETTAGTLLTIAGLVGTVAGSAVMVENAAHGNRVEDRWVGVTTAGAGLFLTGLVLLWSGSHHQTERDRLELALVREQQLAGVEAGDAGAPP